MKRICAESVIFLALACMGMASLKNVYAAEATRESGQIRVEVMIFKVELGSKDALGLTWGKNGEMRGKEPLTIVEWLKKQGELTLINSRNFYAANNNRTAVNRSATAGTDMPGGSRQSKDFGNNILITPVIDNDDITMAIHLDSTSLRKKGELTTDRYSIDTFLRTKNDKTIVIDDLIGNPDASADAGGTASKTAIVILITPHIIK